MMEQLLSQLQGLLEKLGVLGMNYLKGHSYFITGEYYERLFATYFSFAGFLVGLAFLVIVFFATGKEGDKRTGFFKVVPFVAVINSCGILMNYFNGVFHQSVTYSRYQLLFPAPDNIISGFLLTLVICSCYRGTPGYAFLFGLATHGALSFLNYMVLPQMGRLSLILLVMRVILAAAVCAVISRRKYFYTGWIWYFGFHMFLRVAVYLVPLAQAVLNGTSMQELPYTVEGVLGYLSQFAMDGIIFLVVLGFAIVFEKAVLSVKEEGEKEEEEETQSA